MADLHVRLISQVDFTSWWSFGGQQEGLVEVKPGPMLVRHHYRECSGTLESYPTISWWSSWAAWWEVSPARRR